MLEGRAQPEAERVVWWPREQGGRAGTQIREMVGDWVAEGLADRQHHKVGRASQAGVSEIQIHPLPHPHRPPRQSRVQECLPRYIRRRRRRHLHTPYHRYHSVR